MKKTLKSLTWKNTFCSELPGDKIAETYSRNVYNSCFSFVNGIYPKNLKLITFSKQLSENLGLNQEALNGDQISSLQDYLKNELKIAPWSSCYGGHQFGTWAEQLGDGRACTLGEIVLQNNNLVDFQVKGSGVTPYSRGFDGRATLQSSIREFLGAEALSSFNIPTTKILAVYTTGEVVLRSPNNDNKGVLQIGAMSIRMSSSLVRFGNFELPFYNRDFAILDQLIEYVYKRNFNKIETEDKAKLIFESAVKTTAILVAKWQSIGFVHGVLNTDNMSIIGETIDYGPYGFLEEFNLDWTPNMTDNRLKRYTYQNQPRICHWNLEKLVKALSPIIEDGHWIETQLASFWDIYFDAYYFNFRAKLGIDKVDPLKAKMIIDKLMKVMSKSHVDFTIFFREFSCLKHSDFFNNETFFHRMEKAFYNPDSLITNLSDWNDFLSNFNEILEIEKDINWEEKKINMEKVNPRYIPRNWILKKVVDDCDDRKYELLSNVYEMIQNPYTINENFEQFYVRQPDWKLISRNGCQLSCSS